MAKKEESKNVFFNLAAEIEKECGDWQNLPETDEDRALKKRIIDAGMKWLEEKEKRDNSK